MRNTRKHSKGNTKETPDAMKAEYTVVALDPDTYAMHDMCTFDTLDGAAAYVRAYRESAFFRRMPLPGGKTLYQPKLKIVQTFGETD